MDRVHCNLKTPWVGITHVFHGFGFITQKINGGQIGGPKYLN